MFPLKNNPLVFLCMMITLLSLQLVGDFSLARSLAAYQLCTISYADWRAGGGTPRAATVSDAAPCRCSSGSLPGRHQKPRNSGLNQMSLQFAVRLSSLEVQLDW